MKTSTTIGLLVGLALLGGAAFIFLRQPQGRQDPLANLLGAAPDAIEGAGKIATTAASTGSKIIKAGTGLAVDIAVAPTKLTIDAGKKLFHAITPW